MKAMKTTAAIIFSFAIFFSFFVLFAQTAHAAENACSPPYSGYTGQFSTPLACVASSNYCISDGSVYFGFTSTKVGASCTSTANACGLTNGTCDSYGNCAPPPDSTCTSSIQALCLKTTDPITDSEQTTTASGKVCTVNITHVGFDYTDNNSQVSFENYDLQGNPGDPGPGTSGFISMDDNPSPSCDNNLTWNTNWDSSLSRIVDGHTFHISTSGASRIASNILGYGFQISSPQCVIANSTNECLGLGKACQSQVIAKPNDRTLRVTSLCGGTYPCDALGDTAYKEHVDFVECTTNAQCTPGTTQNPNPNANSDANANTAKCNLGITSNFNPNTCIDSMNPSSKITKAEDEFTPGNPPGFALSNSPITGVYSAFLKAYDNGNTKKTWYVFVEDTDNSGGSGIDSCFMSINGLTLPRVCNSWASFTVGKPATGAYCTSEGNDTCKIKVWAQDLAGNKNDAAGLEREIGINPTTLMAPYNKDERKYNDFTTYSNGFNVWYFGVDWTPPTAQ